MWRPRTAMVLAAGLGVRMRPLTDRLPKPLVPLAGRPLIDHVLDRIRAAGIPRVVVNVHHEAAKIERHLAGCTTPEIVISDERGVLLETGGGVRKALHLLGPEPFLINNSDSVWIDGVGSNLERLFATWDAARMDFLLLLAPAVAARGYDGRGDFALDGGGRLVRRGETGVVPFVFTGLSIARPEAFAEAPAGSFSLNVLWDRAIRAGRAFGVRAEGTWLHVGTPEALDEAERTIARVGSGGDP